MLIRQTISLAIAPFTTLAQHRRMRLYAKLQRMLQSAQPARASWVDKVTRLLQLHNNKEHFTFGGLWLLSLSILL